MPIFSNTRPLLQLAQGRRGLPMPPPAPQVSLAPLRPQSPMAQQPTQQQMRGAQVNLSPLFTPQQLVQMQQMAQQPTQQQMQQMAQQRQPIQSLQAQGQGIAQMPMVPGNLPLLQSPIAQQPTQQQMQQMQQMAQQLTQQQMAQQPTQQQMQQMAQQQLGGPGFTPTPGIMPMVPAQLPQPLQQGIGAAFQQFQQQLGLGQMPSPLSPLQQQAPAFGGVNSALQSAGLPTFQQLGQQGFGQMPPPFGQSPFGQPQQQGTPSTSQTGAANAGGRGLF